MGFLNEEFCRTLKGVVVCQRFEGTWDFKYDLEYVMEPAGHVLKVTLHISTYVDGRCRWVGIHIDARDGRSDLELLYVDFALRECFGDICKSPERYDGMSIEEAISDIDAQIADGVERWCSQCRG